MTHIDQYIAIVGVTLFTVGILLGWYVRSYFAIRDKAMNILSDHENTGA